MRRFFIFFHNFIEIPLRLIQTHISIFALLQDAQVNKTAAIASGVKFYRSNIGKYSYINRSSFVADVDIGNFTSIGSKCEIGGAPHPLTWVSTSPVFHKWRNIMKKNFANHEFEIRTRTHIGNDVLISSNCMIKAGVNISNGAVIGMGSVVTKDVGPYEIWAGNPARLIRKRFDDESIEYLQKKEWWYQNDDDISLMANYMTDIKCYIEKDI